jgi:Phage conserved hypothetical protein BR0599
LSFLVQSKSIQDSQPVELYKFTRGNLVYRTATCSQNVIHEGETYFSRPVKRGKIRQSEDIYKNVVEFTFPRGDDFASYYLPKPSVFVTLIEIKRGEGGDFVPFWKGRQTGVSAKGNKVILQGEPKYTSQKRAGLRIVYESSCCNTLYEDDCKVSRAAFERFVTVTAINGRDITVTGLISDPDHWFTNGMVKDTELRRYHISRQIGSVLTTFLYPELRVGDEICIFPGCDQQRSTCINKFNNGLNFTAFADMPHKNPFMGSII